MIQFTMKILSYHGGTYTVEYVPDNAACKPIKLHIQLEQIVLNNKDQIVERLKEAAPQEFWYNQLMSEQSAEITATASNLVNTTYRVHDEYTEATLMSFSRTDTSEPTQNENVQTGAIRTSGNSTPAEMTVSAQEQETIKLKVLIQQVIQEMAEATV